MHVEAAGAKVRPFSCRDGKGAVLSLTVCISNRQLNPGGDSFGWKSLHLKRQRNELETFPQPQLGLSAAHSPALRDDLQGTHARRHLWDMQTLSPGPRNWNLLSARFLQDVCVDMFLFQLSSSGSHLGCSLESPGAWIPLLRV